jgi:hypothetical protein
MRRQAVLGTRITRKRAADVFPAVFAFLTLLLFAVPQSASAQTQITLGFRPANSLQFTSSGSRTISVTVADATTAGAVGSGTSRGRSNLGLSGVGLSTSSESVSDRVALGSIKSPEPMTFLLFGGGLLVVGVIVRRRLNAT